MGIDVERVRARARHAYEAGRWRWAMLTTVPLAITAGVAVVVNGLPIVTAALGVALFVLGSIGRWRGRDSAAAVDPGALAGLVPMLLALGFRAGGHACCVDGVCCSECLPICVVGGVLAGAIIAYQSSRRPLTWSFFATAAGTAVLMGSLGCVCMGISGIAALVAGVLVGTVPLALVRRAA